MFYISLSQVLENLKGKGPDHPWLDLNDLYSELSGKALKTFAQLRGGEGPVCMARDKLTTGWYVKHPCKCRYCHSGMSVPAQEMDGTLMAIGTAISSIMADLDDENAEVMEFNSVNLNYYPSGEAALGWHADDEKLFEKEDGSAVIASLSLGAARLF